eukprot:Phypoly_transcript_00057.p1 GENE.Phypoly_transcript_00057~~Phypoly_transcript_00057.p1  ORF type:complete len:2589 (+),score=470.61 Phypoly_transcript_00057:138-7904(+)
MTHLADSALHEFKLRKELVKNAKWSLLEGESALPFKKFLVLVYTPAEVMRVGLTKIRKAVKLMEKQNANQKIAFFDSLTLHTNFNQNVAIVFQYSGEYVMLASISPISSASDYLSIAHAIVSYFWELHKSGVVYNNVNINSLVMMKTLDGWKTSALDMLEALESTSISRKSDVASACADTAFKYASPEHTGRTGNSVDVRSDIYSLGVLLYELAAGQAPFTSPDSLETIHSHMTLPPPSLPPSLFSSDLTLVSSITAIIHKMLAKSPRDRYQSLYGVLHDIEAITAARSSPESLKSFVPAKFDLYDEFRLPDVKLYGRELEIQVIRDFLNKFNEGAADPGTNGSNTHNTGVLLIGGHSGVGKTSLVKHVFDLVYRKKELPTSKALLLTGKHDRIRHTPYSALIEALGNVVRRLLSYSYDELKWWKDKFNEELAPNAQVLVDVMPDIELIIGEQPAVPQLQPTETKLRFERVLILFLKVILSKFVVVLFLDDMQWADPSTISLLEAFMVNTAVDNLVLVCAYRDNEVDSSHLFRIVMDDIEKKGIHCQKLMLAPIKHNDITQLVSDSFRCDREKAAPLSLLINKKTGGNPFFVGQFLKTITHDKLVQFNYKTREWEWSLDQLRAMQYTENVVDFMVAKIRKLSPEVQHVLQLASCLGNTFTVPMLSTVSQLTFDDVESCLTAVLLSGLVFTYSEDKVVAKTVIRTDYYKFIHDRVQEAFYVTMDLESRKSTHLKIARLLQEKGYSSQDLLFTIALNYNLASDLVAAMPRDAPDRVKLIELNFEAACKAKQSSAIDSAISYLRNARKVFTQDALASDYPRTFEVLYLLAECECNAGNVPEAMTILETLMVHTTVLKDKARIHIAMAACHESRGEFRKSIESCIAGLNLYGLDLSFTPSNDFVEELKNEIMALQRVKAPTAVSELVNLPMMNDEYQIVMRLIYQMTPVCFILSADTARGKPLFNAAIELSCKLSLEQGLSEYSANCFACFSGVLVNFDEPDECYQYGILALKLAEKIPHAQSISRTETNVAAFAQWYQEPMHNCRKTFLSAFKHSVENGDTSYTLYSAVNIMPFVVGSGGHLEDAAYLTQQMLSTVKNLKSVNAQFAESIQAGANAISVFKGTTSALGKFDPGFDLYEYYERMRKMEGLYFSVYAFMSYIVVYVIFGEYEEAVKAINTAPINSVAPLFSYYDIKAYQCIAELARLFPVSDGESKKRVFEIVAENRKYLDTVPAFECKITLIEAEVSRVKNNDPKKTLELFDLAIKQAGIWKYPHLAGYANEQAMKYAIALQDEEKAFSYFSEARDAYYSWGAFGKTAQLELLYPALSKLAPPPTALNASFALTSENTPGVGNVTPVHANKPNSLNSSSVLASPALSAAASAAINPLSVNQSNVITTTLDLASVMKACQVLSSEIDLTKLLQSMVKIVMQNSGAQRGIFVAPDPSNGKLFVEAMGEVGSEVISARVDINQAPVPVGIIQYVFRTKLHVLTDDAGEAGKFTFDPYVQQFAVKSVLCVPVLNQAKVVGILYLENNLMPGTFTNERLEIVQILSSQIAISFENATLYKNLQSSYHLLQAQNERLREMDQIKDQFLANTSHELRTPLNGIIGLAESMQDNDEPENLHNNLAMIVTCGKRLSYLVNDILDLSALKVGTLNIRQRPVNTTDVVEQLISLSSHLIGNKDLKLINKIKDLPNMNIDENRIQQVLQNVIGNAIKFTKKGSVTISNHTTDDWVSIVVSDTGCGIPESEYETIFEDFKQVDGSASREAGGTGLGLSIAKRLVELHGGMITVESELDKGSTFTVSLPAKLIVREAVATTKTTLDALTKHLKKQEITASKQGTATVLSVDDDPMNQAVIQQLLGNQFNVIKAMSGPEALEIIQSGQKPPDFVLLDWMMPNMSGLEVCEKLRQQYPMCDLPIIMVSAKTRPEQIAEGLSKGANDYMTKPVNKQELLARIRVHLMVCEMCKVYKSTAEINMDKVFVCDSCRTSRSPEHSHRIPALKSSQNIHAELTQLINAPMNCLEIINKIPVMATVYHHDGTIVLRNIACRRAFNNIVLPNDEFMPHVVDRDFAAAILDSVSAGNIVETVVNVSISNTNRPQYHRVWVQPLSLTKGFNIFNCVLVVESDETFMCGMHSHNNMIIPEMLRMINDRETSAEIIVSKAIDMIVDLADLKEVEIRSAGTLTTPNFNYGSELLVLVSNLLATFLQFSLASTLLVELESNKNDNGFSVCISDTKTLLSAKQLSNLFLTTENNTKSPSFSCPSSIFVKTIATSIGAALRVESHKEGAISLRLSLPSQPTNFRAFPLTPDLSSQDSVSIPVSPGFPDQPAPPILHAPPNFGQHAQQSQRRGSVNRQVPTSASQAHEHPQTQKSSQQIPQSPQAPANNGYHQAHETTTHTHHVPHAQQRRASQGQQHQQPHPAVPQHRRGSQVQLQPRTQSSDAQHQMQPTQESQQTQQIQEPSTYQTQPTHAQQTQTHEHTRAHPHAQAVRQELLPEGLSNVTAQDIKHQELRLALMRATFNTNCVEVKFRPYNAEPFFHKIKLHKKSINLLRSEVARRLRVAETDITYLVTNGDELVEQDEQLEDGLSVIVY